MRFDEVNLDENVLQGIEAMNFQEMTPVQEQTIPVILEGKDIIGCAQTGTGKTAAYTLPLLSRLVAEGNPDKSYPRSHHGTYPGIGPTDRHAIRRFFLFSPHFDDRSLRRRRRSRLGPAKEGFINGSGCGDRHSGTFIITHRQ